MKKFLGINDKLLALISVTAAFFFITVGYSNCGRIGQSEIVEDMYSNSPEGLAAMAQKKCNDSMMGAYSSTYFPIVKGTCFSCHAEAQGSKDLKVAYSNFMSRGKKKIQDTIQISHTGRFNVPDVISKMKKADEQFDPALVSYNDCMAAAGNGSQSYWMNTNSVAIPQIETTAPPAGSTTQTWVTLSIDLENDVDSKNKGRIPAILTVKAQYYMPGSRVLGLKLKEPSLKMKKSGQSLTFVNGLTLKIDNVVNDYFTSWISLGGSVSSTSDTIITPANAGVAIAPFEDFGPANKISFKFENIVTGNQAGGTGGSTTTTTLANAVTWTQLTAPGGVFANSCVGCHRAGGTYPNLTNYTEARSMGQNILNRMRNQNNPMPRSGLLSSGEIDKVRSWVDGGLKQ